jgi:hypothetical protein
VTFHQWDELLEKVERHGMGPLLFRHITLLHRDIPADFLRGLKFLSLRHRQANRILIHTLEQVLSLLASRGMPCLVLKGAALCHTIYPEPGLRPMRDIDLLLTEKDSLHAHALLQKNGFRSSTAAHPDRYYHLPPLYQTIEGMQVCVELHHGLFPNDPPYYTQLDFAELFDKGRKFDTGSITACCPGDEEMLWHLFQHGFHAPLTYEPFKLISAADLIGLVEQQIDSLDWEKIASCYPELLRSLPFFHALTPWQDRVAQRLRVPPKISAQNPGEPYCGWPRK